MHGLQLASYCVGGLSIEHELDTPLEFANALGAPMLSGWLGREPELVGKLATYLRRYDQRYAIENHGSTYSLATAEEILAACRQSDRIGACPDTGIFARATGEAVPAVELLAEQTIHTHLKGYSKEKGVDCAPGDDDIGLDRVVRILRDTGYSGVYSIEFEARHDPDPELARARKWMLDTLAS
jgi:sugar phosphate isomerase/epimerase